jgi:hypothetical protein
MVRLAHQVLKTAPSMQAIVAGVAVDQLRAMVSGAAMPPSQVAFEALRVAALEAAARGAQLPEIEAIDFRREQGQTPTDPEQHAWHRIERFASLIVDTVALQVAEREPCRRCGQPQVKFDSPAFVTLEEAHLEILGEEGSRTAPGEQSISPSRPVGGEGVGA